MYSANENVKEFPDVKFFTIQFFLPNFIFPESSSICINSKSLANDKYSFISSVWKFLHLKDNFFHFILYFFSSYYYSSYTLSLYFNRIFKDFSLIFLYCIYFILSCSILILLFLSMMSLSQPLTKIAEF